MASGLRWRRRYFGSPIPPFSPARGLPVPDFCLYLVLTAVWLRFEGRHRSLHFCVFWYAAQAGVVCFLGWDQDFLFFWVLIPSFGGGLERTRESSFGVCKGFAPGFFSFWTLIFCTRLAGFGPFVCLLHTLNTPLGVWCEGGFFKACYKDRGPKSPNEAFLSLAF